MKSTKLIINILFAIIWLIPTLYIPDFAYETGLKILEYFNLDHWSVIFGLNIYNVIAVWPYFLAPIIFYLVGTIYFSKYLWFSNSKSKKHTNADELKKYADLRDQGIITEEEFQAKKKKILDL